jgi:hypothetical protein
MRQVARHPYVRGPRVEKSMPAPLFKGEVPDYMDASHEAWTEDEQKFVSAEAYQIYGQNVTQGRMSAIREAVKRLPRGRQKFVNKWFQVRRWIVKDWSRLDALLGNNFAQANVGHLTPVLPPASLHDIEPQEVEALMIEAAVVPVAKAPYLDHATPVAPYTPRKKTVFWKPDEKESVALAAAALMLEDDPPKPLEAVRQAQAVLSEERQRTLRTTGDCADTIDRAINLMPVVARNVERKADEERAEAEANERIEREARERTERETHEAEERLRAEAQAEAARLVAQQQEERDKIMSEALNAAVAQQVNKRMDEASYVQLLGALAKKVLGDFMGEMSTQIKADVSAQVSEAVRIELAELSKIKMPTGHVAETATVPSGVSELKLAPKDHLPRVVVVGLVNQQYDDLKKAFFGMAELTLVKSQAAGGNHGGNTGAMVMKEAERADVVVALVEHCGMDVKNAGHKLNQNGPCPFIGITGSTSGAKRWIRQWLNGEVALAA